MFLSLSRNTTRTIFLIILFSFSYCSPLYQGTLRVLLVLLHDFPEFLCDYYLSFCDVIPSTCVQLRNLILSAFPRSMRLPDPFTPNLKVREILTMIWNSEKIIILFSVWRFFCRDNISYDTTEELFSKY